MHQSSEIPPVPQVRGEGTPPYEEKPVYPAPKKGGWKSVLTTLLLLALAPLIAWALISFVFQSYEVDGPSMERTLSDKDRLIVVKTDRTWSRLTGRPYIPPRGEIIVFIKSDVREFGTTQERQLIKRVIGLPGERVVIDDGIITVYNAQHPDGFNPDAGTDYEKNVQAETNGDIDLMVGENEVFVIGDNRSNSLDSRSFGTIDSEDIVGRLMFRLFPVNKAEKF
jgi:signal peptidase I